jgi:hypothetical protein
VLIVTPLNDSEYEPPVGGFAMESLILAQDKRWRRA